MKQLVLSPEAYIGVQKNRKKAYANNVIYLDNNQEFQIELYNPTSNVLGAEIWLNDALSSTSKLVLKPGERVWIDRYLDTNKKYLFNTYEIKDTKQNQEAIKNNGKVTIKFYKESNYINGITWTNTTGNFYPQTYPTYPTYYTYASADTGTISDTGTIFCSSTTNIDTGRVEKGKES